MTNITKYTISQLKTALNNKEISAIELTTQYLEHGKKFR